MTVPQVMDDAFKKPWPWRPVWAQISRTPGSYNKSMKRGGSCCNSQGPDLNYAVFKARESFWISLPRRESSNRMRLKSSPKNYEKESLLIKQIIQKVVVINARDSKKNTWKSLRRAACHHKTDGWDKSTCINIHMCVCVCVLVFSGIQLSHSWKYIF